MVTIPGSRSRCEEANVLKGRKPFARTCRLAKSKPKLEWGSAQSHG